MWRRRYTVLIKVVVSTLLLVISTERTKSETKILCVLVRFFLLFIVKCFIVSLNHFSRSTFDVKCVLFVFVMCTVKGERVIKGKICV